ncbi:hypothetical protein OHB41_40810 [Streptomyces sp. NBC_01571]|uniref:hypothetical protein n=1 Tax=Streptomyces sp. NBC_01571 TaxID=2975883 RepID=UPI00224F481A|nr:hypothetical protein [Streptomyces sp. NBC_01571]MCX4579416.1 hypothetical protein [Streptomyces sp. NBC_01571]
MTTRNIAVTAAVAAATALVATGVTYASATAAPSATPTVNQIAPSGGDSGQSKGKEGNTGQSKGNEGGGGGDRGGRRHYEGHIDFNERTYSARSWGCITVVSGLGSRSFNVRNDSHKTVEVFRGATCDNGSPLATVGPWSTANGIVPFRVHGGVKVRDGVVGSFRVVEDHHGGGYGGGFGGGDRGGDGGGFGGDRGGDGGGFGGDGGGFGGDDRD